MFAEETRRLLLRIGLPAAIVLAALLLGLLFQRIVVRRLQRLAQRTANRWDDALIAALRGMVPIWFLLAGTALALQTASVPAAAVRPLHRGIVLLSILSVAVFAARLAAGLIGEAVGRVRGMPTTLLKNVTWTVVTSIGALVMLDFLGISITPIITALGVGGLAVALALQDTLSNFFSGIHLLVSQTVRPGDYVRLETGDEGYVTDITWRSTSIRALADNLIVIPNNKLAAAVITNFHLPQRELSVAVPAAAPLDCDLAAVEQLALDEARRLAADFPGAVAAVAPVVRFQAFAEEGVRFTVYLRVREFADQFALRHEFVKRLHARMRRDGIALPAPERRLTVRRGRE